MITLNHLIVPARDKGGFRPLVGRSVRPRARDTSPFSPPGRFAVVRVGDVNLDFDEVQTFEPHHYAFLVDDEAFDRLFARLQALGVYLRRRPRLPTAWQDQPSRRWPGLLLS
jgi:catechol 2,3-dioxygenase-like lactoylglutathione lyase family enzyme